jgi:sulfate adenylyltransferase subunit 2
MKSSLNGLIDESVTIIREVAAEFERPVLLFSGGKDSVVMLHLAVRAFAPARIPFPVMHIDTGHNFAEVIEFRDRCVADMGVQLIVGSVQASIDSGRIADVTGPRASRNPLQTVTLLDSIAEHKFDAVFGGARRDEERARAKERVYSHRDSFGQWDPKNQRPELWGIYNGRHRQGEHFRIFPTGPSSTFGRSLPNTTSTCRVSTTHIADQSFAATTCGWQSLRFCNQKITKPL